MFSKLLIAFALIAAVSAAGHVEISGSGSGSGSAVPVTTEEPKPDPTKADTTAPATTVAPTTVAPTTVAPTTPEASGSGSGSEVVTTEAETTEAATTPAPTPAPTAAGTEAGVTYREAQTFSTQIDAALGAAILALTGDAKTDAIKKLAEQALAETDLTYDDVESADIVESAPAARRRRAAHGATFTLEVVFKSSVTAEESAAAVTKFNAAVTAGNFELSIEVGGQTYTFTPGAATGGTKQVKDTGDKSSATTAFVSASSVLVAGLVAVAL